MDAQGWMYAITCWGLVALVVWEIRKDNKARKGN